MRITEKYEMENIPDRKAYTPYPVSMYIPWQEHILAEAKKKKRHLKNIEKAH